MATAIIKCNDVGTHIFKWWDSRNNLRVEGVHPIFKGMKPRVGNNEDAAGSSYCRH